MCPPFPSPVNPEGCAATCSSTIAPVHDLPANDQEGPAEPTESATPDRVRDGSDLSAEVETDAVRAECLPQVKS